MSLVVYYLKNPGSSLQSFSLSGLKKMLHIQLGCTMNRQHEMEQTYLVQMQKNDNLERSGLKPDEHCSLFVHFVTWLVLPLLAWTLWTFRFYLICAWRFYIGVQHVALGDKHTCEWVLEKSMSLSAQALSRHVIYWLVERLLCPHCSMLGSKNTKSFIPEKGIRPQFHLSTFICHVQSGWKGMWAGRIQYCIYFSLYVGVWGPNTLYCSWKNW